MSAETKPRQGDISGKNQKKVSPRWGSIKIPEHVLPQYRPKRGCEQRLQDDLYKINLTPMRYQSGQQGREKDWV